MPIAAKDTKPGRQYKASRERDNRIYYLRSLIPVEKYVKKLKDQVAKKGRKTKPGKQNTVVESALSLDEERLLHSYQHNQDQILMRRCLEGTDPFTKGRYEFKTLVLVPIDYPFEEIGGEVKVENEA